MVDRNLLLEIFILCPWMSNSGLCVCYIHSLPPNYRPKPYFIFQVLLDFPENAKVISNLSTFQCVQNLPTEKIGAAFKFNINNK